MKKAGTNKNKSPTKKSSKITKKSGSKLVVEKALPFSKKTLDFLVKAGRQKSPLWLDKNKDEYQKVLRIPFVTLAEKIKEALRPMAPDYHFPTHGLARIKRPAFKVAGGQNQYKDWISMIASRPSKSRFESNPHLFFGLFPNEDSEILLACGLWQPSSQQTRLIREAISLDAQPFKDLFFDPAFKARFKKGFSMEYVSKKIPRGFKADHKDQEWIKLKKFVVIKEISLKDFSSDRLSEAVIKDFEQALRLNRLLDKAIKYDWPPNN